MLEIEKLDPKKTVDRHIHNFFSELLVSYLVSNIPSPNEISRRARGSEAIHVTKFDESVSLMT